MKESTRRTQRERRADSEHKLLEATAQLIVEHGFGALSLVAIGERAGTSHALINHLFGTKGKLVERLNDTVDALYLQHLEPVLGRHEGTEAVVAFGQTYLTLVTSDDPLARVHLMLWSQAIAGQADLRQSRVDWDRHFREGAAQVVARATGRAPADAFCTSTALVIVGLLRGLAMQHLLDPEAAPLATALDGAAAAIRGLLPSDSASKPTD